MSEKNNSAAQALLDLETIKEAFKKESMNTARVIVGEEVRDIVRKSINEAAEDDDDMQIIDNEKDSKATDKESEKDKKSKEKSEPESEEEKDLLVDGDDEKDSEKDDGNELPEPSQEDGDEDEFPGVKVGENEYDITGEKDDLAAVRKVYKLMQDGDEVVLTQDGEDLHLKDNGTGAEYVIDLSDDESDRDNNETDEFALELDGEEEPTMESKKMRKPMKEERTFVLEADLGYTDDYQGKDAIEGLSAGAPKPGTWTIDNGLPKSDAKPWAGNAKSKSKPFGKEVTRENCEDGKSGIKEATNVTMPNIRKKVKSHSPSQKEAPKAAHQDSKAGEYKALQEAVNRIKAENLKLKEDLVKMGKFVDEACVTNKNLGQAVKLFLENTTSRDEKIEIINRFSNEAKTVEQSKALYESISRELKKTKKAAPVMESQIAVPRQAINETSIYQSPEIQKMVGLSKRMEKLYK